MTKSRQKPGSTAAPAELRGMFGANLRMLARDYPSVAGLCRDLDINRTQFNRYLSGESFPRPDVLYRICQFFGLDARMLLEPVRSLNPNHSSFLSHPVVDPCFGETAAHVPEHALPSGFYRFSRHSFLDDSRFVQGLVYVFRQDNYTFVRGFEAKEAMREQGLPLDSRSREFRGFFLMQEDGVAALINRRDAHTGSFNFLTRASSSFQNNVWEGYVTRTSRENVSSRRATRMVYEHLGRDYGLVMAAARASGYCTEDDLIPFHRRLLRLDQDFR